MPKTSFVKWIPLFLRTYDGQPVTPEDAGRPEVRASLMGRQRNTLLAAIVSVHPTVLAFVALLWSQSSQRGLLIWAGLAIAATASHWIFHLRLPLERVSEWRLSIAHGLGGLSWGLLALLALPEAPEWQAVVGAMLIAVLAAGMVFSSQFAIPFASWVLSLSVTSVIGFLLLGTSVGVAVAILLVMSALFCFVLGAVLRAGDRGASVFAARNADLVRELQVDKQRLGELATTDSLTGTKNRLAFNQDLAEAMQDREGSTTVLMVIDLDGFKLINDSLGHQVGDEVLRVVTSRIETVLHSNEELYRIGGDELTVIKSGVFNSAAITDLGERLIGVFNDPVTIASRPMDITASIGISCTENSTDAASLMRGADQALYRAKRSVNSEVVYFDSAMRIESDRMVTMREEVAGALESGQIVPWLQPVVEMTTGKIVGAEALARWEHPEGVRSAGSFIEAIEESGKAPVLDRLLFDAVCAYRPRLDAIHGEAFFISFNVSPTFLQIFLDHYADSGKLAGTILEITEQRDLTNHAQLSRLIERAQAAGAHVAVDDFGTGFSSMERLSLGSFDGLKIDGMFAQSLAERPTSKAIVASMAEIGRQLRVPVVAEGIEVLEQAAKLVELGVRWGQGYLYAPAIPVDELSEILERQRVDGPTFSQLAIPASTLANT